MHLLRTIRTGSKPVQVIRYRPERTGEYDLFKLTYLMAFSNLPVYKTLTGRTPSEGLPKARDPAH